MWDCKTSKMSQSPLAALNAFGLFAAQDRQARVEVVLEMLTEVLVELVGSLIPPRFGMATLWHGYQRRLLGSWLGRSRWWAGNCSMGIASPSCLIRGIAAEEEDQRLAY